MLPFAHWPIEDRRRWEAAFQSGDLFDENGPGIRLAAATRQLRLESYGRFLGFLSVKHPRLLKRPPEGRIDRRILAEYVAWRRKSCGDVSLAADLGSLRGTLKLICPDTDWSWLQSIANRIAAAAPQPLRKYNLVTSDRLYALGNELMDGAVTAADAVGRTGTRQAIQYRDGLIMSTLAMIPLRRGTLAALQIGRHLIRVSDHWELDIPAADTKTRRPLDYSIPKDLSARLDLYLERFRGRIRGSDKHAGLWSSHHSIPMRPDSINVAVHKRTRKAFGFGVNLHRFRHAAASFWSIHDPVNVRGAKDLLGQVTFATTEKHYIMAQSRLAGRALARAVDRLKADELLDSARARRALRPATRASISDADCAKASGEGGRQRT
jgi:integrase